MTNENITLKSNSTLYKNKIADNLSLSVHRVRKNVPLYFCL